MAETDQRHRAAAVELVSRLGCWGRDMTGQPETLGHIDLDLVAQALAAAEHAALSSLESAMAHIKASGHCGSAIMSVPQILAWAREIGWQG